MNNLKHWLKEQDMTQEELARELGLTRPYVSRVANGDDMPETFCWRFYKRYGQDLTCAVLDTNETGGEQA